MQAEIEIYDVKVTQSAWAQLIEHARFLANVSEGAANRLVEDFTKEAGSLSQMPERCPWLTHDAIPFQKYRKFLIGKFHLALFEIRGNTVFVTAVVDCRQDYAWLI